MEGAVTTAEAILRVGAEIVRAITRADPSGSLSPDEAARRLDAMADKQHFQDDK